MFEVLELAARIVGATLGLLLLYIAFFLYESQEGRIQSRLEDFWIAIDDRKDTASRWIKALVSETARLSGRVFDRVFGPKLISVQSLVVAFYLTAASILIVLAITFQAGMWVIVLMTLVGLLPAIFPNPWVVRILAYPPIMLLAWMLWMVIHFLFTSRLSLDALDVQAGTIAAVMITLFVDIGWVLLLRRALASVATEATPWRVIKLLALCLLALMILALPFMFIIDDGVFGDPVKSYLADTLRESFNWLFDDSGNVLIQFLKRIIVMLMLGRLFLTLTAFIFMITFAVVLAHRLLWPVFSRVVYAIARYKIINSKKLLGTVAFAILSASLWKTPVISLLGKAFGLD